MKSIKPLEKRKGSFKSRVLRLMGKDRGFELNPFSQEEKKSGISELHSHYDFTKALRNAMLEAEQDKAKGIAAYQKRRFSR